MTSAELGPAELTRANAATIVAILFRIAEQIPFRNFFFTLPETSIPHLWREPGIRGPWERSQTLEVPVAVFLLLYSSRRRPQHRIDAKRMVKRTEAKGFLGSLLAFYAHPTGTRIIGIEIQIRSPVRPA